MSLNKVLKNWARGLYNVEDVKHHLLTLANQKVITFEEAFEAMADVALTYETMLHCD